MWADDDSDLPLALGVRQHERYRAVSELPELTVPDAAAWQRWLIERASDSAGVWLVLAKKGTTMPTTLTYDQALEAALGHGWIDGQLAGRDEATFRRRFTPRRSGSAWSKRNTSIVDRLIGEGRMYPAGLAAVEQAKIDGRWAAAYAGAARMEVPADLATALSETLGAQQAFDDLDGSNRYAVLYRITTARRPETRSNWIEKLVAMLARGETLHPPRKKS